MKKASPKMVGVFVLGAIVIVLAAVVLFGSGRIFETREKHVAFFEDSISGLRVGAPVEFRGIPIGTVVEIWAQIDPDTGAHLAPVIFEIDVDKVRGIKEARIDLDQILVVDKGLRAQLALQSFVTGQQVIQLDFFPGTPLNIVETTLPYDQFPTIPAKMVQLQRNIDKLGEQAAKVLERVEELLDNNNQKLFRDILENVAGLTEELETASKDVAPLMADARAAIGDVRAGTKDIPELVDNANATVLSYKTLAEDADDILGENRGDLRKVISGLRETEDNVAKLVETIEAVIAENRRGVSDFTNTGLYEVTNLAIDMQGAVEQFRRVLEEMERDPARFFLGKPGTVEVE